MSTLCKCWISHLFAVLLSVKYVKQFGKKHFSLVNLFTSQSSAFAEFWYEGDALRTTIKHFHGSYFYINRRVNTGVSDIINYGPVPFSVTTHSHSSEPAYKIPEPWAN